MNRTQVIIGKLVRRLTQLKFDPMPRTDELLSFLNDAELELSQRGPTIKDDITFYTDAGEGSYDLGSRIFRIRQLIPPKAWKFPVEVINNEETWKSIVRSDRIPRTTAQPLWVTVWDNRLKFWPVPIVTGDEIEVLLFRFPSRAIDETNEPECDKTWDNCLEYSVLDQLVGGDWTARYVAELERLQQQNLREILSPTKIEHWSNETGF
jgi:hypothetical protein